MASTHSNYFRDPIVLCSGKQKMEGVHPIPGMVTRRIHETLAIALCVTGIQCHLCVKYSAC